MIDIYYYKLWDQLVLKYRGDFPYIEGFYCESYYEFGAGIGGYYHLEGADENNLIYVGEL